MVLLRCNIFRASYVHLIKDTDSMYCRDMQVRFLKVKTLLNNAFKIPFILITAFRSKIQRGVGGGGGGSSYSTKGSVYMYQLSI